MVPPAPGLLCRRMVVYGKQYPISGVYLKQTNGVCDTVRKGGPSSEGGVVEVWEVELGGEQQTITAGETT